MKTINKWIRYNEGLTACFLIIMGSISFSVLYYILPAGLKISLIFGVVGGLIGGLLCCIPILIVYIIMDY